ncbi:MAG: ribonuclease E/G [Gammaproteobacteria bacterium]|nr:ribonuclease E/G [Gammaproteobacteria bacterium]|tara:strand:- start:241566 stop:243365 length:1800 start_codon:yes stop_codon:yes gene_type:complete
MKQILLNASQKEEVRLAIIQDNSLIDLDIEIPSKNIKSNIYKGIISRVEPSLEAAFVNFGRSRHGFLPFKEISSEIFVPGKSKSSKDCLESGKEIVVQVDKEERGTKGAALSTYLSLAGKYLVLLPKNPNTGGISRRLEGDDRLQAKKLLNNLDIPDGMSVILRTSGLDASKESLTWDMNYLIQIYESVLEGSVLKKAPFLIYQESSMMARLIRDYCNDDIDEVIIDNKSFYEEFLNAKEHFMPHFSAKSNLYEDSVPIFSKHRIESQIQNVYRRKVSLPSGGNVVFDKTEALTSIDVNSAKSTQGGDIEETALNTNLEAVSIITTQLKLRDIGGLIVIDFIDMLSMKSKGTVMRKMAELAKLDRAKIQFGRISKFGLMEVSRQKLKSTMLDSSNEYCPTCSGSGHIKSLSTLSVSIARIVEEEAIKSEKLTVYLPVRLATYLLNEKREMIQNIEKRQSTDIKIIPDPELEGSNYSIDKQGLSEEEFKKNVKLNEVVPKENTKNMSQTAFVSSIKPKSPPPKPRSTDRESTNKDNFFSKIMKTLFGKSDTAKDAEQKPNRNRVRRFNRNSNYKQNKYRSYNNKRRRPYNKKTQNKYKTN